MALSAEQAEQLADDLSAYRAKLYAIVHGGAAETVETDGGTVKTVAKVIADADAQLAAHGATLAAAMDTVEDYRDEAEGFRDAAAAIAAGLTDAIRLKGEFDASTGSFPADPDEGDWWIVTTSGSVGALDLVEGDEIIYGPSGWFVVGRNLSASEIVTLLVGQFTDAAHGNRGGGALHAEATTGAAGFMSAGDKGALDLLVDIGGNGTAATAGRLTLTSGVAVTTEDVAGASTVHFTPCNGNEHSLYDGEKWVRRGFPELDLELDDVHHAANTDFGAFLYWDDGAGEVKIGTAPWATTLEALGGALVNAAEVTLRNGATTTVVAARRAKYVGAIATTLAGETEDSGTKRFVSNLYNVHPRKLKVVEAAANWNYSTDTWRWVGNHTYNRADFILASDALSARAKQKSAVYNFSSSTQRPVQVGIGLDRADGTDADHTGGGGTTNAFTSYPMAEYFGYPGAGRHYFSMLERANGGGDTILWFGNTATALLGEVMG